MRLRSQILLKACLIFIFALAVRVVLNIFFFTKFGPHATVEKEIWYYYGTLQNIFQIHRFDPTYWIFLPLKLIPEEFWLDGLVSIAVLLSSLTAVLVFLFGAKLFDERLGFWAGMIYAFSAGPLGMSVANFTHDLVQLPIIVTLFLAALYISKVRGFKRLIYIAAFLILTYAGLEVGPLIIVAVFISLFYMLLTAVQKAKRAFVFCLLILFVLLLRLIFLDNILGILNHLSLSARGIDLFSQIQAHARDLMPITVGNIFVRAGFWLILVFLGLLYSGKKMEPFSLIILSVSVIFAFGFARVVRLADIGFALIAAYAFNYSWLNKRSFWAILILSILTIMFCYHHLRPNVTEAEYRTLSWLKQHSLKQDKILIPWSSGYFLKSVSGREPSSSPEHIDFSLHRIYWEPLEEAYQILKNNQIKFVQVSNRYFGVIFINPESDDFDYVGDGSLIYRPEELGITKFSQLKNTFLFKLMDEPAQLENFQLAWEVRDRASGTRLRIYLVK